MRTNELIEMQRKEKVSPYLQDLGEDFYTRMKELIKRKHSKLRTVKDEDFSGADMVLKELENIKNVVQDLYETRERKIVASALYYVKSGEEIGEENLSGGERKLMQETIDTVRRNREELLSFGSPRIIGVRENYQLLSLRRF